jgi:hypothetical protein
MLLLHRRETALAPLETTAPAGLEMNGYSPVGETTACSAGAVCYCSEIERERERPGMLEETAIALLE